MSRQYTCNKQSLKRVFSPSGCKVWEALNFFTILMSSLGHIYFDYVSILPQKQPHRHWQDNIILNQICFVSIDLHIRKKKKKQQKTATGMKSDVELIASNMQTEMH